MTQRTCLLCSYVKTNQLIVHLLCKNSLKISQHTGSKFTALPAPNTPNRVKLPTLQVNQNHLRTNSQRSQGMENGMFSVHLALSDFTEQIFTCSELCKQPHLCPAPPSPVPTRKPPLAVAQDTWIKCFLSCNQFNGY